jgi:hypothetical protein
MAAGGRLLFGRRTSEQFAGFWPHLTDRNPFTPVLDAARKDVVSSTLTRESGLPWQSTLVSGDVPAAVRALKEQDGKDISHAEPRRRPRPGDRGRRGRGAARGTRPSSTGSTSPTTRASTPSAPTSCAGVATASGRPSPSGLRSNARRTPPNAPSSPAASARWTVPGPSDRSPCSCRVAVVFKPHRTRAVRIAFVAVDTTGSGQETRRAREGTGPTGAGRGSVGPGASGRRPLG